MTFIPDIKKVKVIIKANKRKTLTIYTAIIRNLSFMGNLFKATISKRSRTLVGSYFKWTLYKRVYNQIIVAHT